MKRTARPEEAMSSEQSPEREKVGQPAASSRDTPAGTDHFLKLRKSPMTGLDDDSPGHLVETCFGRRGCPNRAVRDRDMAGLIEGAAASKHIKDFLRSRVNGPIRPHHTIRISISDCPNACSRPQIADIGLIGARVPEITDLDCMGCGACVGACREEAVNLSDSRVSIDPQRCLACGHCIEACPSGTIRESSCGYRLCIGGKLGRRPQLAVELKGVHESSDAIAMIERCLEHYKQHCTRGERFGELIKSHNLNFLE